MNDDRDLIAFLKAVRRFMEAEYEHAGDIGDDLARETTATRDKVDLAHADLMNFPTISCDLIIDRLKA